MIWEACNGEEQIKPISGNLYRLVESQEQSATLEYVDTLDEQAVLEALLDQAKPDYPQETPDELHYLLKTPFRYPPLQWGSRFGRVHEPSLFYGAETLEAVLSESAYYRFVFLHSIEGTPPSARLKTEHTLFSVGYKTAKGIQLQKSPFSEYTEQLLHRQNYIASQTLGTAMRQAGVEAFQYLSARSTDPALCAALYTVDPFTSTQPQTTARWLCELTATHVTFKAIAAAQTYHYPLQQFEVEGQFPLPA